MKRFLSIFAIMAMIVSMFSGVAFADPPTVYAELDNDSLIYETGFHTVELSGKVFNDSSDALEKIDGTYEIHKFNGTTYAAIEISGDSEFDFEDGTFDIQIPTYDHGVGNYKVVFSSTEGNFNNEPTFTIVYDVELETPAEMTYAYPVSGQKIIQGVFVNGDGPEDKEDVQLIYKDDVTLGTTPTAISTANFSDGDSFGFLFNGSDLDKVGDIGIYVEGVLMLEGSVEAGDLTVAADPLTLNHSLSLGAQDVVFDFDLADDYVDGNGMADYYQLRFRITDPSDDDAEVVANTTLVDDSTEFDTDEVESQKITGTINVDGWDPGAYDLTVELYFEGYVNGTTEPATVVKDATLELEVEDPDEYNLTAFWSDTMKIDGDTLAFSALEVIEYDGTTSTAIDTLSVTYEGAGLEETTVDSLAYDSVDGAADITFEPTETGIINVTVNVYDDTMANDGSLVATFEKEIEVTGWNVEITPVEVVVDTVNDFVVTITNEDGTPVNNAYVYIDGVADAYVDSRVTNIQNGMYLIEDVELDTVQKYTVKLDKIDPDTGREEELSFADKINVIGEEVYTVESDTPVMLNGIEEKINVSVLDSEGDVVYPTFYLYQYDVDGDPVGTEGEELTAGTRTDIDEDGIKEAVELTITPDKDAVELVVRATTDSKKKMGQTTMEVQLPMVMHTGAMTLTENFENDLEFTVVDPRDDSVIDETITITFDTYTTESAITALSSDSDDVWTATYLVEDVDWTTAEDDEKTVEATIKMDAVELGTLEVVKPSLTSDPEKVIIGAPNNLVITYLDGDGNPLVEYDIEIDGEEIGETDENGQVSYATATVSSQSLTFNADTDNGTETTDLTVKSTADIEGPVATVEVDGNTAVIKISDNVRIQKVAINGELVDMFFAMPEVTHMVTLDAGVNTFNVQAVDINNNYTQTTLEVEPEMMTGSLEFTIGEESEYGTPELMEGTTMVPVRFAEQLGATVGWDAPTATVTYMAGDTVIELTIGSTTAVVNGENVQLSQAPYINDMNRTMVPLRMISEELGFTVTYVAVDQPILVS